MSMYSCKNCTERHIGCHSNCTDYNAEKILKSITSYKKRKEVAENNLYWDYIEHKNFKTQNSKAKLCSGTNTKRIKA